ADNDAEINEMFDQIESSLRGIVREELDELANAKLPADEEPEQPQPTDEEPTLRMLAVASCAGYYFNECICDDAESVVNKVIESGFDDEDIQIAMAVRAAERDGRL